MNLFLRMFLVAIALVLLVFVLRKIKKSEFQAEDSVFWFLFAASFVILAAFPQIAYFFASILGFESPANFIFLYAIGILLIRVFSLSTKVAHLRWKLNTLVQEMALRANDEVSSLESSRTDHLNTSEEPSSWNYPSL
ncbi:DUF2304 domain-containing protein [Gordonibacter massiliensis]|uniref:DUF2304 domain-containing protein n=2 Tax=Gordonibacter massiliensis (ex Traore et al. 2017) TaxID=1841863 RepID=A0A842JF68_9ACTN|nr:DUF2304 domain-containing protein [Gordonibacter massiliensis (ex Traore et al. 2017)]